ncbi:cellulose synthase/poly-beta-1,6-N-acetylglucosamine synthase-like glycosyltransferase [Dyadobacter jejuensis]|uniref:Cellulose synthase/poly-beta-1,6-N-acetylglucosamine synthase-like glycosyltransferase n=1 Tax=Dyadobacter jejuensis TaxID=1082580 RepID=A0A316B4S4_9BACT|nr:glycosyltransferase [Dyadobacter jejuensis]PWJ57627.1 cellulose synthase/poly-beta-1,6-N-acetylglucosamine synthase-like glycosyltransferase [Dyadobacter jejuensis]
MTAFILYLLMAFVAIQLVYYLLFFARLAFYSPPSREEADRPGVSVLVCAWNELENLEELLPLLDAQEYPQFEVILLDDRSDDGSEEYIRSQIGSWKHVKYIRINESFEHITPKKYALTVGMKQAQYPLALMTDADCRPQSTDWITAMVSSLGGSQEIVLGFSPYYRFPGVLNWFIRCETFYTAVQYLSFALGGFTYMGVGRNIMYKRSLFFANKGFYRHSKIYGGDDDIFLNEVATSDNTGICLDSDAFAYSYPKMSWRDWYRQKTRHLSVSHYYRTRNKILLALLSGAHVAVWTLALGLLAYGCWQHDRALLETLGIVWGIRWLMQLILLVPINNKLDRTLEWYSFLPMDFALYLYYIVFGWISFTRKKPRTSWN